MVKKRKPKTNGSALLRELAGLRQRLDALIAGGLAQDPLKHAEQVAVIAGLLSAAFDSVGLRCTVVGGSAIEIHAPGVYRSGDIDLVIETVRGIRGDPRVRDVFSALGFEPRGRLWVRGDLVVDTPSSRLSDPDEVVAVGDVTFRVIKKEALLRDRIVGFKWWKVTGYGQQAAFMLAAFGEDLDLRWLRPQLESEAALDAFVELKKLAMGTGELTDATLRDLLARLHEGQP